MPFVRGLKPGDGRPRLTASMGVLAGLPSGTDSAWLRGPVTAAGLSLQFGKRYVLSLGGSAFSLGAEGDFVLVHGARLSLGLLHGIQLSPGTSFSYCYLLPCQPAFAFDLAFDLELGALVEIDPPRVGSLVAAVRYGYGSGIGTGIPIAHQVLVTLTWSTRVGHLRVGPEIAFLFVVHPDPTDPVFGVPSDGLGNVLAPFSWAVVPSLTVSTALP